MPPRNDDTLEEYYIIKAVEEDLNKLMHSVSQLSEVERKKLLTFLIYKSSFISEKDKETIEFLTASSERLKKWMDETDETIKETEIFLNDIKRSA